MAKKYYIMKIDKLTDKVWYKKSKCVDGWCRDKSKCWQFSKQGAEGIVWRLTREYRVNGRENKWVWFTFEEVETEE